MQKLKTFLVKWIKVSLLICILGTLLSAAHVAWFYNSEASTKKDCAVIFGAAVWDGNIASHALSDRTFSAADLYKKKLISCIVASGGPSRNAMHEVDMMKKLVTIDAELPESVLTLDYKGLDTLSTLRNLDTSRSYILVSNDFHLGRIKLLAGQTDLKDFDLHASTYLTSRYPKEPYFFFREIIANIFYGLRLNKIKVIDSIKETLNL